jgi:hypothetical protein
MNPWLYARQVKEFRAVYDTKNNSENVTWVENTIFGNDAENNYQLIEIEPEKKMSVTRTRYRPIDLGPQNA